MKMYELLDKMLKDKEYTLTEYERGYVEGFNEAVREAEGERT